MAKILSKTRYLANLAHTYTPAAPMDSVCFLAVSLAFCFLGVAFGAIAVWIGLAIALSRTQFATDRSLGTHCCCR